MNNDIFSYRLKSLRLEAKLSQKSLGELVGLSMQSINDIENSRSKTTLEKASTIADYFNVSIDYLVGRTNDQNASKDIKIQAPPILSEKKEKLLQLFDVLDDYNQGALIERASMLLDEMQKKETAKYKKSV